MLNYNLEQMSNISVCIQQKHQEQMIKLGECIKNFEDILNDVDEMCPQYRKQFLDAVMFDLSIRLMRDKLK